jgi:molybdate transport system substrate-binding protein
MQNLHDLMHLCCSGRQKPSWAGRRAFVGLAVGGMFSLARAQQAQRPAVRVVAASDLQFALPELAARFSQDSGERVELNFGSSGKFAQQILQGLPADIYMAADESFVFQLADAGLTQGRGDLYALGRVAVLVPTASTIALDPALRGLRDSWARIQHFAIANPEHAPYGRAAQQVLQHLGMWQAAQPKLVLGENISQATQFVTSGAAQAGISALSLALAPDVAKRARHLVLPADLHEPLRQRMVLLRSSRPHALRFYQFLQSAAAQLILRRYGFAFQ